MYIKGCATDVSFSLKFRRGNIIMCALKSQYSVADNTVPVTIVPRTLSQAPVFLVRIIRRWSFPSRSVTSSLGLVSLTSSLIFCPSLLYSMSSRRWLPLENSPYPITAWINSVLARCKIWYFSFADVMGFGRPRINFFNGIVLRVPTMSERVLIFLKKMQGKKFSRSIFSTPANASPIFFMTRCRNIYSDLIVRTNAL